jgi:hypothetical protein
MVNITSISSKWGDTMKDSTYNRICRARLLHLRLVTPDEHELLTLAKKHSIMLDRIEELNPLQRVIAQGYIERLLGGEFGPFPGPARAATMREDWTVDY